ncbi:MAG TPA: hypothetical protein VFF40_11515 [Acidimicrobiia bacterium]|nr:hypothetical protein [Acidimicrobiia bacterium]
MNLPDDLDVRRVATYLGRTRAGAGLAMVAAPGVVGHGWFGPVGGSSGGRALARAIGVREAVLGAGSAIALGQRRGGGDWVSMLAVCDAGDALVSLLTPGLPKRSRLLGLMAAGSAVAHFLMAQELAAEESDTAAAPPS